MPVRPLTRHDRGMRTVALLAYDGSQVLDVAGPAEVFSVANEIAGGDAYETLVIGANTDVSSWNSSATAITVDPSGCS